LLGAVVADRLELYYEQLYEVVMHHLATAVPVEAESCAEIPGGANKSLLAYYAYLEAGEILDAEYLVFVY
jgi:hypothetical protein